MIPHYVTCMQTEYRINIFKLKVLNKTLYCSRMNATLNNIQNEYVSSVSNEFETICVIQKKYFEVFSDKKQNQVKNVFKKTTTTQPIQNKQQNKNRKTV